MVREQITGLTTWPCALSGDRTHGPIAEGTFVTARPSDKLLTIN